LHGELLSCPVVEHVNGFVAFPVNQAVCVLLEAEGIDQIELGRAPIARRTPISRVRSVTATSMMFMMPIPPTKSETAASAVPRPYGRARAP